MGLGLLHIPGILGAASGLAVTIIKFLRRDKEELIRTKEDLSLTKEALEETAKKLEITVQELVETKDELGQIRGEWLTTRSQLEVIKREMDFSRRNQLEREHRQELRNLEERTWMEGEMYVQSLE